MHNLFTSVPARPAEVSERLVDSQSVRIERIISHGHASPEGFWYDQPQSEWIVLITGRAQLRFEDELLELEPGDWLNIPAHKKHRVESTNADGATIWLAVHYS